MKIDKDNINKYFIIARHNVSRMRKRMIKEMDKHQIMKNLIKTRYSKRKVNGFFMVIVTQVVIFHLNFLLCFIIAVDYMSINFIIHIFIAVVLHFFYYHIYHMVELYKPTCYKFIKYIINNYSEDNFREWKIKFTTVFSLYLLIIISVVKLDKVYLIMSIIENLISFFIIDIIENNTITNIMIDDPNDSFEFIVNEDYFET